MKAVCLDTNILIEIYNQSPEVKEFLDEYEMLFTTSINAFEFLAGSDDTEFITNFHILPFTERTAFICSQIYRDLRSKGRIPPVIDLMIASICIENGLPIITRDKDFQIFKEYSLKVIE